MEHSLNPRLLTMIIFGLMSCNNIQKVETNLGTNIDQSKDTTPQKELPLAKEYPKYIDGPACINGMIDSFIHTKVTNPPRKIIQYLYKDNVVYYVPALCCDFYSDLYSESCILLGHPDGGITGKGDGRMKDFDSLKTSGKVIWQDQRSFGL